MGIPVAVRKALAFLLASGAVVLPACGGDDETTSAAVPSTTTTSTGATGATGAAVVAEDAAEIEDAVKTWLLEGDCDLMTDQFLEDQTFEDDPEKACDTFEQSFSPPEYGEEDIAVSDIEVNGAKATATVGDKVTNVESTYHLVNEDGTWKIDSADL
jgi:hypothetical protein